MRNRAVLFSCLALVVIAALVIVLLTTCDGRGRDPSITDEQQLMEYVRKNRVIPCYVPSINNFFIVYYNAFATGDTQILEDSYDDPRLANISAEAADIIDRITSVKVYITPGLKKNEVAVFVTYNIFFENINVPVPSADSYYIYMDTAKSQIKILSKMYTDKQVNELLTLISYKEPLRSILAETDKQLDEALKNNTDLRNIYVIMSSMAERETKGGN